MKNYRRFQKALKKDWYTQGFNAVPIFLNHVAWSGLTMKRILGLGYTSFIHNYRSGYGEMNYLNTDFKRIWRVVKSKLSRNPHYLKKIKNQYNKIFRKHEKIFDKINNLDLKKVERKDLLELFKKCAAAQIDSVGMGHLVDGAGLELEKELKRKLFRKIADQKKFNRYLVQLTVPTKVSFMAQEEKELQKAAKLKGAKKKKALENHLKRYFWIQNSYAGPQKLTVSSLEKHLKALKPVKKNQAIFQIKNRLIRKLKLSKNTRKIIELIDFIICWQDERKMKVIKTVGYFGKIIDEISCRTKIDTKLLYYLGVTDVLNLDSIDSLKILKKDLKSRVKGVFFLMQDDKEFKAVGSFYHKLIKTRDKITQDIEQKKKELHGSTANGGTAFGRAVVCKDLPSFKKVKNGDILITSMTRPEFMPVLKKVAAMVTDEGGVTSHAAIVARELDIPAVIGTRVATKILKDGAMIEVKANHGVVRILS